MVQKAGSAILFVGRTVKMGIKYSKIVPKRHC